ncbi:MAG: YceI family protein [Chromatiaceae bacterium]|nr:YceI family protein [Gammaproteobacteria bacterium]MCP5300897.1 YceI family protein [Chromatiaceae bacterium]MCP5421630.1 YceI family protein [Chromatiaceae bacterium]
MSRNLLSLIAAGLFAGGSATAVADDYVIDSKGAHAFIQFQIKHLGYSWLIGRFNTFAGEFSYDENNPAASKVSVLIDAASVDSNHAERDKHLRNEDFLEVDKFPEARFVSTAYRPTGEGTGVLAGELTLHGITRPITIDVTHIGAGPDPWGGYRRGFEGRTQFALADFGIKKNLGPASKEVTLWLGVEGIRR